MKKFFKPEDMKVLMSTWEELDNTSSDEEIKEEEEANLCVENKKISFDLFEAMKHSDVGDACFEEEEVE